METLNTASSPQMPVWNTVLRYGGFCAAGMVVLSLLIYITNFNVMALSGLAVMYISMFGICFATAAIGTKYQRDQLDGGYITYGKAVLVGLLIVLVGMFVSSLWNYILVNFIDPNYVAGMKEQFVEAWGEKMPAESLEEALKGFDKSGDLLTNIKNGIVGGLVIGLIVGLITAAFLKKQPETTKF
ncbi:MAG: DUF4199 domain-containing protein [Saprospiraceae bacterium]|nr:DUF4199 domain-containing protein [Saprospiraceae bacterium]